MCKKCSQDFVHLHAHTHFSVQDALGSPKEYAMKARSMGFPAAAITDHGKMGGIVEFVDAARAEKGDLPRLKPILGIEAYTCADRFAKEQITTDEGKKRRPKHNHLGLIAKNEIGYRNLLAIAAKGAEEGFYYEPRIDFSVLEEHHEGVIAFSGCLAGEVSQALLREDVDGAERIMKRFKDLFGDDYYAELQYHGIPEQKTVLPHIASLADKLDIPLVATNDVHYMERSDWRVHDVLIQMRDIRDNDARAKAGKKEAYKTHQFWLKSRQEMEAIFGENRPQALDNTLAVAEKVEDFLKLDVPHVLPHVPIPVDDPEFQAFRQRMLPHHKINEAYLAFLAFNGLKRLGYDKKKDYVNRLRSELQQIWYMGVTDYFLIQHEMVQFMQNNDIYYGIRGSGVGSMVNYCLSVCKIDPLRWNLMFERFLNPGRGTQYNMDIDAYPSKQWLNENGKVLQNEAEARLKKLAKEKIDSGEIDPKYGPDISKEIWVLSNQGLAAYLCDIADKGISTSHNDKNLWSAYMLGLTSEKPEGDLIVKKVATLPDIDTDIDDTQRSKVIQWAYQRFGKDHVKMIGTWGTYGPKAALVGCLKTSDRFTEKWGDSTHQMALKVSSSVSKFAKTLDEALADSEDLRNWQKNYPDEFEVASKLIGTISHLGVHAAGVLVGSEPISWHTPIEYGKNDIFCSAFDMKAVERVGLVKYDYLGLATYQILARAVKMIKQRRNIDIDLDSLPLDDPKVFRLYTLGKTSSVFQFASEGMQEALRSVQASNIEDLIAVAALYRPGPKQYIPDYAAGKKAPESVTYAHPLMKKHLEVTYGIMVYQEQAMFLARDMAELDWNEVDKLRKAISKKTSKEFEEMRSLFKTRALARGIDLRVIEEVLHLMEKFGLYAFNRAHACAYAILSYWTAYLRVYYPAEWLASCMQVDHDDEAKMAAYKRECRSEKIVIKSPHVQDAGLTVSVNNEGAICLPLVTIKGVGDAKVHAIVMNQPYNDFDDLMNRAKVDKGLLSALYQGGALSGLSGLPEYNIANHEKSIEALYEIVESNNKKKKAQAKQEALAQKRGCVVDTFDFDLGERPSTEGLTTRRRPTLSKRVVRKSNNIFGGE